MFISIEEAIKKGNGKVSIHGWVYRERKQKDMVFLVIRDSSNIIQAVIKQDKVSKKEWDDANKVLIESSLEIEGELKEDKRAPTNYEIQVSKLNIIQFAEVFPIKKDQSPELLLDNRHLWLRSRKQTSVLKIRSTVFKAIHDYFHNNNFYEFQSPIIQSTQAEGGSTLFHLDYFGKKLFLAQTWQLYAEPAIFALEKVYCIAPSFRAEKSKTSRHLTEYWHAEMEVAWEGFDEIQNYGEALIKYVIQEVIKVNKKELELLERDVKKLEPSLHKKFPRITYTDALKLLKNKCKVNIEWGKDLRTIEEDKLSSLYDTPVIVTHYPKIVKAFYMKEDEKDKKVVLGCDFIAPEGYGEIIGGSEREPDPKKIVERLEEQGEDPKNYSFYLDTRKYGSVPHAGFGMGVERLIAWICGLDNIKDAIPYPRTMLRYTP